MWPGLAYCGKPATNHKLPEQWHRDTHVREQENHGHLLIKAKETESLWLADAECGGRAGGLGRPRDQAQTSPAWPGHSWQHTPFSLLTSTYKSGLLPPSLEAPPLHTHTLFFSVCFWGAMLVVPRSHSWLYTWKSRLIRFSWSYRMIRIKLRSLLILALELSSLPLPSPISLFLLEVWQCSGSLIGSTRD